MPFTMVLRNSSPPPSIPCSMTFCIPSPAPPSLARSPPSSPSFFKAASAASLDMTPLVTAALMARLTAAAATSTPASLPSMASSVAPAASSPPAANIMPTSGPPPTAEAMRAIVPFTATTAVSAILVLASR